MGILLLAILMMIGVQTFIEVKRRGREKEQNAQGYLRDILIKEKDDTILYLNKVIKEKDGQMEEMANYIYKVDDYLKSDGYVLKSKYEELEKLYEEQREYIRSLRSQKTEIFDELQNKMIEYGENTLCFGMKLKTNAQRYANINAQLSELMDVG